MRWFTLLLVMLALWTGGAVAQTPVAPDAGSNAPKPPKPGAQAPDKPPAGRTPSVADQFGDWTMLCGETKDKSKPVSCSLGQQLVDATGKQVAFELTLGSGPRGNLILVIRAPLGVALAKGVEMSFGGQAVQRASFSQCLPKGCRALLRVTEALKAEMRKAPQAFITVYAISGTPFRVTAPLKGLDEALTALDKRRSSS